MGEWVRPSKARLSNPNCWTAGGKAEAPSDKSKGRTPLPIQQTVWPLQRAKGRRGGGKAPKKCRPPIYCAPCGSDGGQIGWLHRRRLLLVSGPSQQTAVD